VKVFKKEIGLAVVLAVLITTLAAYTNSSRLKPSFLPESMSTSESELLSMWGLSDSWAKVDQQAWQVWETIEGELRQGTFETVVGQLEALTRAKCGYICSEDLFFCVRNQGSDRSQWNGRIHNNKCQKRIHTRHNRGSLLLYHKNSLKRNDRSRTTPRYYSDLVGCTLVSYRFGLDSGRFDHRHTLMLRILRGHNVS
jgi:hypothetical protein